MNDEIRSFFVYGTLKQGQLRGGMWPRKPISIQPATIKASLFDLGSYPGIIDGSDEVLGELWTFDLHDMPATIESLDRIEGYESLGVNNEYIRKVVLIESFAGDSQEWSSNPAYSYFVGNQSRIMNARRIQPGTEFNGRQVAQWPDAHSRVPKRIEDE